MFAIFDKRDGSFLACLEELHEHHNEQNYLIKKLPEDFDAEDSVYVGDFYKGKVIDKSENPNVLRDEHLKFSTTVQIQEEYSLHKQLNIIIEQLDALDNSIKTDDFKKMSKYLKAARNEYKTRRKGYVESPDTIFINENGEEEGTHRDADDTLTREELKKAFDSSEDYIVSYKASPNVPVKLKPKEIKKIKLNEPVKNK